jgi:hypothetical protein
MEITGIEQLEGATTDAVLKRLYDYWCERRRGKRYPSRRDIDPAEFSFALGRVSLIDVFDAPCRFRYRLVATTLTENLGYEMTGKFLDQIPQSETRAYTEAFYTKALAAQAPFHARDEVVLDGRRWKHEALVLPLSADGVTIDMLMIYRATDRPSAAAGI